MTNFIGRRVYIIYHKIAAFCFPVAHSGENLCLCILCLWDNFYCKQLNPLSVVADPLKKDSHTTPLNSLNSMNSFNYFEKLKLFFQSRYSSVVILKIKLF